MKLFFWIDSAKTSIFGKSFIYLNQVFVDLKSQKSITICGQNMEIPDIVGGCLHNETSEPALLTAAPSTWNCQASGGALARTGSSLAGRELHNGAEFNMGSHLNITYTES